MGTTPPGRLPVRPDLPDTNEKGGFFVRKSRLPLLLALALALSLAAPAFAAAPAAQALPTVTQEGIATLYTNHMHTHIGNGRGEDGASAENALTYSIMAGYKNALSNALLVAAGDAIQGAAYGSMDIGQAIVNQAAGGLYADVTQQDWFYSAVEYVTQQGYMVGIGEGLFDPGAVTTRGALVTMLARFNGNQLEATNPWYQAGIDWAMAQGVSDGSRPTQSITRVEAVTMMWRLLDQPQADADLSGYTDNGQVPAWGLAAVEWAVSSGILQGSDNQLNPNGTATRAQIAQLMMKLSQTVQG